MGVHQVDSMTLRVNALEYPFINGIALNDKVIVNYNDSNNTRTYRVTSKGRHSRFTNVWRLSLTRSD